MILCALALQLHAQQQCTVNGKVVNLAAFSNELQQVMEEIGIPAVSLALIDQGKVVFSHNYGYKALAQKSPVDSNTVFEACSLSKSYLVYAVFRLVEQGKIKLDTPIYKYMEPGPALDHDPRYRNITPRMILSHCSGIENWKEDNNRDTLEILSDPGKTFVYSGTGYNYLAEAISAVIHQPYESYVQELVLKPLSLTHSYFTFTEQDSAGIKIETPADYATGHDVFGKEIPKWKNREAVPSSANIVTAADYAKLVIATFDGKHLSAASVNQLRRPQIRLGTEDQPYYYGPGFEILCTGTDTIIGHGGNNAGFKGQLFYSLKSRSGFVLLANSDRGKLMTGWLNRMTARLDIDNYYKEISLDQYPSNAIRLFKDYRTNGRDAMFTAIADLREQKTLDENALVVLADLFMYQDTLLSRQLLEMNAAYFPVSALTAYQQGNLYKKQYKYESAYQYYRKAQQLHLSLWTAELQRDLVFCSDKIADAKRRKTGLYRISDTGNNVLEAEEYNNMAGIEVRATTDSAGGHAVGFIDTGDWMEYTVQVPAAGRYHLEFRVSSAVSGGRLQLQDQQAVLVKLNIPVTQGWESWTTLATDVNLPEGRQTLKVYADSGGFDINWIHFSKISTLANR